MSSKNSLLSCKKDKSVPWGKEELIITLGYYFFIYKKNTRKKDYILFANDLRKMTGNSRTNDSVGLRFMNYANIDNSNNGANLSAGKTKCLPIWKECIEEDGTPKISFIRKFLKFIEQYGAKNDIYNEFLLKYSNYIELNMNHLINSNNIDEENVGEPIYLPENIPELIDGIQRKYRRSRTKAKRAIVISNYECNIDSCHQTFFCKNGKRYMEAHHLVPLQKQELFKTSLDVDANIVCLCPLCHRKLHYGKDIREELKKLFDTRKELLEKSGIVISFEKLLSFYEREEFEINEE